MELDNIQRPDRRGDRQKRGKRTDNKDWKKGVKCYNCQKKGHFSNECPSPRKQKSKGNPSQGKETSTLERKPEVNNIQKKPPEQLKITVLLCIYGKWKTAQALVDSGAGENYISRAWIKEHHVPTRGKENPYEVTVASGTVMEQIRSEVPALYMEINNHREQINLDVLKTHHDVILGMPWLQQHQPQIDWVRATMEFDSEGCKRQCFHPRPRQVNSIGTGLEGQMRKEFPILFKEYEKKDALSEHRPWDHHIPLQEGKEPRPSRIY